MLKKTFIIAEAGVNHNGDIRLAKKLIDTAVWAGADAVKFQTFKAEKLVTPTAEKAAYQKDQTGSGTQFDMLKKLELSKEAHDELYAYCDKKNIEFMSTAFDEESLDYLVSLGIKRIKIPSGEITNTPLLRHIASKNLAIILSTGMADLDEISEALAILELDGKKTISLLHCTSNYPTALQAVNLMAIKTMAKTFNKPIGYSDHTEGILIAPVAVALGATIIEKHFTLDKTMVGPDHLASLEPQELHDLVSNIRRIEQALGDGRKKPQPSEREVKLVVRRSVTLSKTMTQGTIITSDDLMLRRPGHGIAPKQLNILIGKRVKKDLPQGTTLQWHHVEDAP